MYSEASCIAVEKESQKHSKKWKKVSVIFTLTIIIFSVYFLSIDTDSDNLANFYEIFIYATNPFIKDTDHDGLSDGYEVYIKTDPRKNWRQQLNEDAIKSALSKYFREQVSQLAKTLKGKTLEETAWNILKWVGENIEYNEQKAKKTVQELNTPLETITLKKGICADYALLTAALLLEAGVNTVYIIVVYTPTQGHVAAAIVVNNETYVLDQQIPPVPYENYEHHLAINGIKPVNKVKAYKISLDERKEPVVTLIDPQHLPQADRKLKYSQLIDIIIKVLRKYNPQLTWDPELKEAARRVLECHIQEIISGKDLECRLLLPPSYFSGVVHTVYFTAMYLSQDFAYYWVSDSMERWLQITIDAKKYTKICIVLDTIKTQKGEKVLVAICLANKF